MAARVQKKTEKPPKLEIPDATNILALNLIQAAHLLRMRDDAILKTEIGINPRQFGALHHLMMNPGLGSGQLARWLMITPQSTGPLLDGLKKLGYIARDEAVPGQLIRAHVTPKGREAVERAAGFLGRIIEADHARLEPDEVETLNRLLRKLIATFSPE